MSAAADRRMRGPPAEARRRARYLVSMSAQFGGANMNTIQRLVSAGFAAAAFTSASVPALAYSVWPDVDFQWYAQVGKDPYATVEIQPAPRAGLHLVSRPLGTARQPAGHGWAATGFGTTSTSRWPRTAIGQRLRRRRPLRAIPRTRPCGCRSTRIPRTPPSWTAGKPPNHLTCSWPAGEIPPVVFFSGILRACLRITSQKTHGPVRLHDEPRGQDRSAQAPDPQGHFALVLPGRQDRPARAERRGQVHAC